MIGIAGGNVYCKCFSLCICERLKNRHADSVLGLQRFLELGKCNSDSSMLLSTINSYSTGDTPHISATYVDWSFKPISLIALTNEGDILNDCIDHFLNFVMVGR